MIGIITDFDPEGVRQKCLFLTGFVEQVNLLFVSLNNMTHAAKNNHEKIPNQLEKMLINQR